MIDKDVLEQFQLLVSMIEKLPTKEYVEERITKKIEQSQQHLENRITNEIAQSQQHMEIRIANAVAQSHQQLTALINELPTKDFVLGVVDKSHQQLTAMINELPTKDFVLGAVDQSRQQLTAMINELPTKEFIAGYVDEKVNESRRHTEILIENTITKRIDSLHDGYKLTREKQADLEHQNEALQEKNDTIEQRLFALENKTA
jgi:hypothetical protein